MELRERAQSFVLTHLSMVEPIARKMSHTLPKAFELEDLIGAGRLGLVQAGWTFTPQTGASTDGGANAWAYFCIRRAILNAVSGKPYRYAVDRRGLSDSIPLQAEAIVQPVHPALEAAKRSLDPRETRLLELIYDQNQSIKAIARERSIGLSRRSVQHAHRKALHKLRVGLEAA